MSSLDVRAQVSNLQFLVGLRLANIYDISPRLFVLKFSKPDFKAFLLIETGVRFHTTEYSREKPLAPSPFTSKLRKHLRTRRLLHINQLGLDRVVDMGFSVGEEVFHVILELYASGNILLTDQNFSILTLLRSHQFDEDVRYAKGEVYPFDYAANLTAGEVLETHQVQEKAQNILSNSKKSINYKQLLCQLCPYMHFPLAEHCLKAAGMKSPNKKVSEIDPELLQKAMSAGQEAVQQATENPQGVLVFKQKETEKRYSEFNPTNFIQYEELQTETLESFDRAIDHYFTFLEKEKSEIAQEKQEDAVWKKKRKIEQDQQKRVDALQEEQTANQRKARLIEEHLEEIDGLCGIMKQCIQAGLNWTELWRMIIEEKNKGNPYAALIESLKLDKNAVCVKLTDQETNEELTVKIHIYKTAFQNASDYYSQKKHAVSKEHKTKNAMQQVIKEAEKKAKIELKKQQMKIGTGIRAMRKTFWWEKFNWFVSSENYLIISGKDAQQNEMIVKRYMRKGDVYVHADIAGASSTVIKNPSGAPVPVKTLEETGIFCVSLSQAWTNKVISPAWWVHAHQVSKTAPTGLYLKTGSFMIRGKKNYLRPSRLEMSLVLLFKLGEDSLARHKQENLVPDQETMEHWVEEDAEGEEFYIDTSAPVKPKQQPKQTKPDKKAKQEKAEQKAELKQKQLTKKQARKLKKAQEKYGHMDEESRKLRMQLLGAKEIGGNQSLEEEKQPQEPEELQEPQEPQELQEPQEPQEPQKPKESKEEKESKEVKQILEEENLLGEEEIKSMEETETLTGKPLSEDTLLYCIPMCAPTSATNNFKFRAKLTPGNTKKGKAVSSITYSWMNMPETNEIEKQLIKAMTEIELITVLPGKVTVNIPGAKKK